MENSISSIIINTISKIKKTSLCLNEKGEFYIKVNLHSNADIIALIQKTRLTFTNEEKVLLKVGIATLLNRAGIGFLETTADYQDDLTLRIPASNEFQILDAKKIRFSIHTNHKIIFKEFEFKI